MSRIVSYAQNKEDIILSGFFGGQKEGFYVDVGAGHPVLDSVTKYFYVRGWSGINIEPNKKYHKLLEEDRERDINLNIGVAGRSGKLSFREYENYGLSTFSDAIKEDYKVSTPKAKYVDRQIEVKTLAEIFADHNVGKIDFLKIDVEGFEHEVLKGNDWSAYRPSILCIEANHVIKNWRPILDKNGYELVFFDGLNEYYAADEFMKVARKFSYPDVALLSEPIIQLRWHQEILKLEDRLKRCDLELQIQKDKAWEAEVEIRRLHEEMIKRTRPLGLLKGALRGLDHFLRNSIEGIATPKGQRVSRNIPIPQSVLGNSAISKNELLRVVQINDLKNFYSQELIDSQRVSLFRRIAYRAVMFPYAWTRRLLKLIFRKLRFIKNRARKAKR